MCRWADEVDRHDEKMVKAIGMYTAELAVLPKDGFHELLVYVSISLCFEYVYVLVCSVQKVYRAYVCSVYECSL